MPTFFITGSIVRSSV